MIVIPAIDIIEGRAVRLSKGDYDKVARYDADPIDLVKMFVDHGLFRIHAVDLEGAKESEPENLRVLEKIASVEGALIDWSGGIKSDENLKSVFDAGASLVSIGSMAVKNPDIFKAWLLKYGGDKIILGADVKNGKIAVKGWTQTADITIDELIEKFLPSGLSKSIVTNIEKDGMLQGVDFGFYISLLESYPQILFTVSGGVTSVKDLEEAKSLNIDSIIVGKAFYENRITLKEMESFNQ